MRKVLITFCLITLVSVATTAQTQTFTRDDLDYLIELPSNSWRAIARVDVHKHIEFINGNDARNGYLRLRKRFVSAGTTAEELFRQDESWELNPLPGYVVCCDRSGTDIKGHLSGKVFSYQFVNNGTNMDGRIYYLQLDSRIFYTLHFTIASSQLQGLRSDMDTIARSFRTKK